MKQYSGIVLMPDGTSIVTVHHRERREFEVPNREISRKDEPHDIAQLAAMEIVGCDVVIEGKKDYLGEFANGDGVIKLYLGSIQGGAPEVRRLDIHSSLMYMPLSRSGFPTAEYFSALRLELKRRINKR